MSFIVAALASSLRASAVVDDSVANVLLMCCYCVANVLRMCCWASAAIDDSVANVLLTCC